MATPASPFQYITWQRAIAALALRLNDPNNYFWSQAELVLYISEALQVWNSLTQQWSTQWTTTYNNTARPWQSTANNINGLVGANLTSPRVQTLTSAYVYTLAQYHLLEPPEGEFWLGTTQFSITDFAHALQRRRDEFMQAAAINVGPVAPVPITPGQNLAYLPDAVGRSIQDIRRIRYIPAAGFGSPTTLYREDGLAMEYFNNAFPQTNATPLSYDILTPTPLTIALDASPNDPATLEVLAMISAGILNPPNSSPLFIPDDFNWILKFGMMADLLRMESESTDLARAAYCENRFQEGVKLATHFPWLLQARIDDQVVDTPAVTEMDYFDNEWDSNPNAQICVVRGGMDLFAISPQPAFLPGGGLVSVTLTLVENAPLYTNLVTDSIQVPRDVLDGILDEAQHLASFKEGGSEFSDSFALHQNFIHLAVMANRRLNLSGIFATTLRSRGYSKQDTIDPRFETAPQGD